MPAGFDLWLGSPYNAGMRKWGLGLSDPLTVTLAADVRFGGVDYVDDQIWELANRGGEPAALSFQTTYGLRARKMAIFPGFSRELATITDPGLFSVPPIVEIRLPNYLRLAFDPWPELAVQSEYWVPESHAAAGRFRWTNRSGVPLAFRFKLYVVLRPASGTGGMTEHVADGISMLAGQTGGLAPVVFLSGGARAEPAAYPALSVDQLVPPGETEELVWVEAARDARRASVELVRSISARDWDSEAARIEMVNSSLVDVETGDPAWDAVFWMAQNAAISSFIGSSRYLPHPFPVGARLPDEGYSERGDGRDYGGAWAGFSASEARALVPLILPIAPDLAKGVIRDFLHNLSASGAADSRPGLAGQRSGLICPPMLADLAWRVYEWTEDKLFLETIWDDLERSLRAWFTQDHDRDQDGFPEWDNTTHSLYDDSPTFVRWHDWGQGLDIRWSEGPDLGSMLIRECDALSRISQLIGRPRDTSWLDQRGGELRRRIEAGWSQADHSYHFGDRDRHTCPSGQLLVSRKGSFTRSSRKSLAQEARLVVRCHASESEAGDLEVLVRGRGRKGRFRVERLRAGDFQWFWNFGTATTSHAYAEISEVTVTGLSRKFRLEVLAADYSRQDAGLLLPLWAGVPEPSRASELVRRTLQDRDRYWRDYGVPRCAASDPAYAPDERHEACEVSVWQNSLLIEGLLAYGYRDEAGDLLSRLMRSLAAGVSEAAHFRAGYHPDRLQGFGDRGSLHGVAPVHAFLDIIGVRLISPQKIRIEGRSPFAWPVHIRWRGAEIIRQGSSAEVIFPNGQRGSVAGQDPQLVEQRQ